MRNLRNKQNNKQLETFIAEEYIEAPTLEEAKKIASEEYPYLNPVEEIRELEMFELEINEKESEFYLIEVSDDLILYN